MSGVTDADRERAGDLLDQIDHMGPAMAWRTLADALAEERAEARAPFLALADQAGTITVTHGNAATVLYALVDAIHVAAQDRP